MLSDAVGIERLSRIVGYKLTGGVFSEVSPNLPQRIAIIGQANTANQGTLVGNVGQVVTTAKEVGDLYGYGSPLHMAMRILKPVSGDGTGGIPLIVYPQLADPAGVAQEFTITVVGTATASGTQYVEVAGRTAIDGIAYSYVVEKDDTATIIAGKIADSINAVLASPVTATSALGVVTLVTKWKDQNTDGLSVQVDTNGLSLGVTYAATDTVSGDGNVTVAASLANFGNDWNTIVLNTYSTDQEDILDELEAFNGKPSATNPTGRYTGTIMKPFISLVGSTSVGVDFSARREEVTNAVCLADQSNAFGFEAAANMCVLFARTSQDNPHLDVAGQSYPDMPISNASSTMKDYDSRDTLMKTGVSTSYIVNGAYQVQDFITSYRPDGISVPQYRYCRNLMIDFNVRFGYYLLEQINVVDHVIANDNDTVSATKVVKPKQWIAVLDKYADDLALRALIVDAPFMQDSTQVALSSVNPDRLETFFRYKRSGFMRVASTTAEAGFNFGSGN
jgi:phage tail sheath gpL-like